MESQIQAIKDRLQEERNAIPKAKVSFLLEFHRIGSVSSPFSFPLVFGCRNSSICPSGSKESCSTCSPICRLRCLRTKADRIKTPLRGSSSGGQFIYCSFSLSFGYSNIVLQRKFFKGIGFVGFSLVPDDSGLDILHEPCHLKEEPVAIPKGKKCTSPAPRWYISAEELDSLSSLLKTPGKRLFVTKWTNSRNCDSQVLRHLGRILEARIGHHRVFTLSKPH
ncbi:hypothetical protein GW17_00051555 [Ensete ventricosum]|nr:hypothetical protein GW17_00051555 [Ensete ventricosum]